MGMRRLIIAGMYTRINNTIPDRWHSRFAMFDFNPGSIYYATLNGDQARPGQARVLASHCPLTPRCSYVRLDGPSCRNMGIQLDG